MATLLAHIKIRPGQEARFEELQGWLYEQTHANEPACRRYEFFRGAEPGSYYGLLSFDDFRGFLVHQSSDYHEEFGSKFGGVVEDIKLEWVDPVGKASALAPTNAQDAPAGASDLMQEYARSYAPTIQDWWQALRQG